MKNAGALLIGALFVGGVVVYATQSKKKEPAQPQPQPIPVPLPVNLPEDEDALPPIPDYLPDFIADRYEKCWNGECTTLEYDNLITALSQEAMGWANSLPGRTTQLETLIDELNVRQRSTAGRSTGACCASCAAGLPCGTLEKDEPERQTGA